MVPGERVSANSKSWASLIAYNFIRIIIPALPPPLNILPKKVLTFHTFESGLERFF